MYFLIAVSLGLIYFLDFIFLPNLFFILPAEFILFGGCFYMLFDLLKNQKILKSIKLDNSVKQALFLMLLYFFAVYFSGLDDLQTISFFHLTFVINSYTQFIKCLLTIFVFFITCLFYFSSTKYKIKLVEIPALFILILALLSSLLSCNNLLLLYLLLEGLAFTIYILFGFNFLLTQMKSLEAGIKYFILNSVASLFILYSLTLLVPFLSINLTFTNLLFDLQLDNKILVGACLLFLCGLLFKIGTLPFSVWLPDIYEGAPNYVTTLLMVPVKIVFVCVFIKLLFFLFYKYFLITTLFLKIIILLSLFLSIIAALYQTNLKRLLSYTAINQVGFILISVICNTTQGLVWALIYLIIYSFTLFGTLLILFLVQGDISFVSSLQKLFFSKKLYLWGLIIFLFSFAGLPPLAGFYIKFYILLEAVNQGFIWLVFSALLVSVVGCYVYLRLIKIIFNQVLYNLKNKYLFNSFDNIFFNLFTIFCSCKFFFIPRYSPFQLNFPFNLQVVIPQFLNFNIFFSLFLTIFLFNSSYWFMCIKFQIYLYVLTML